MFDPSVFWTAFEEAGLLVEVQPAVGSAFMAGFMQPDQLDMDGAAQSTDYAIEYQTADAALKRGDALTINGNAYKLRSHPKSLDDGYFSRASLEETS